MQNPTVLVVDDHQDIRELLATYLSQHGYTVVTAANGVEMREQLQAFGEADQKTLDLIVLDLMMPGEDGLSLCKFVREQNGPPIIMLTAMSEDTDCVVGLEMGADDYVTKPFVPRVLLARIKAVLRRHQGEGKASSESDDLQSETATHSSSSEANNFPQFACWRLDNFQRQLIHEDGVVVPLSTAEFKLLEVFIEHPQRVLSRDQLLNFTKGRDADPFDRSIDNQVSRLRKKIEDDPQNPTLIKTVWGGGYLFAAAVVHSASDNGGDE